MTGPSPHLLAFRDHARAKAEQTELERPTALSGACRHSGFMGLTHSDCQMSPASCGCTCHDAGREPVPSDSDRALWTRLADEIDDYLAATLDDGQEALL